MLSNLGHFWPQQCDFDDDISDVYGVSDDIEDDVNYSIMLIMMSVMMLTMILFISDDDVSDNIEDDVNYIDVDVSYVWWWCQLCLMMMLFMMSYDDVIIFLSDNGVTYDVDVIFDFY